MNIGQASRKSGVSVKSIRRYEEAGLLTSIRRLANAYRDYSDDDVRRLEFIRRCRSFGFSLKQIGELLAFRDSESRTCRDVRTLALVHSMDLSAKAMAMSRMAETLRALAESCDGSDRPECLILQRLGDGVGLDLAA
jgi:Cu(I)-responsive transcriptional regulator